jgi:hypothetical protein
MTTNQSHGYGHTLAAVSHIAPELLILYVENHTQTFLISGDTGRLFHHKKYSKYKPYPNFIRCRFGNVWLIFMPIQASLT